MGATLSRETLKKYYLSLSLKNPENATEYGLYKRGNRKELYEVPKFVQKYQTSRFVYSTIMIVNYV